MSLRVIVYVEGPSDKAALAALLEPLIEIKKQNGISIDFFESAPGDRKFSLLTKVPRKAADILLNDPTSIVVALPDLHPQNKVFPHTTAEELIAGLLRTFERELAAKGRSGAVAVGRFKAFCLKYDLEALILAAEESLRARLGVGRLKRIWRIPVEDQNDTTPPKKVVQQLFEGQGGGYKETVDAPLILGAASYQELAERCNQCFRPFLEFLIGLRG